MIDGTMENDFVLLHKHTISLLSVVSLQMTSRQLKLHPRERQSRWGVRRFARIRIMMNGGNYNDDDDDDDDDGDDDQESGRGGTLLLLLASI
jgi:hypothetical protein